jgi:NADPH-dependent 2,4-dienoyl-CoA reductase/sulfur reductase-like enzyme
VTNRTPGSEMHLHRTLADLEATGMDLRLDTVARRIDVQARKVLVADAAFGPSELMTGVVHRSTL